MDHLTEDQNKVYDRQLRVWGVEAQKRLISSKTLLAGIRYEHIQITRKLCFICIGGSSTNERKKMKLGALSSLRLTE